MSDFIAVLRRRWLVIAVTAVIVPVVAVAMAGRQGVKHSASATVLLVDGLPDEVTKILPVGVAKHSDRDFATRAALAVTEEMAAVAARESGVGEDEILAHIEAVPDVSDNTIEFRYANEDADLSVSVVNAYADAYVEVSRDIQEKRLDEAIEAAYAIAEEAEKRVHFIDMPNDIEAADASDITLGDEAYEEILHLADRMTLAAAVQQDPAMVIDYADPLESSAGSSLMKTAVFALIGGLFLGILMALLAEYLDNRRASVTD